MRIVLDGFGAINFDSLSKMQSSMSGIQKIISDIMTSPVEKKFTTFAVIIVWSMMIGAFIDYAVTINIYIERMTGVGGLSIVPNGQSINPFKDNVVTKAGNWSCSCSWWLSRINCRHTFEIYEKYGWKSLGRKTKK